MSTVDTESPMPGGDRFGRAASGYKIVKHVRLVCFGSTCRFAVITFRGFGSKAILSAMTEWVTAKVKTLTLLTIDVNDFRSTN